MYKLNKYSPVIYKIFYDRKGIIVLTNHQKYDKIVKALIINIKICWRVYLVWITKR